VLAFVVWAAMSHHAAAGLKLGLPLLLAVGATVVGLWRAVRTRPEPMPGLGVTPPAAPADITIDFTNVTSYSIGADGKIRGIFDDGIQREMGQLAIADFSNPMGLEKVGETSFRESANSGAAQLDVAGVGRRGTIMGGALEMSNVDLAAEFTNLILAQRGVQACSRVITTSDQVLEDLVNIKR
jgi:flagellar hook protein FlgE